MPDMVLVREFPFILVNDLNNLRHILYITNVVNTKKLFKM